MCIRDRLGGASSVSNVVITNTVLLAISTRQTYIALSGANNLTLTLDQTSTEVGDVVWISGRTATNSAVQLVAYNNEFGNPVDFTSAQFSKSLLVFNGTGFIYQEYAVSNADAIFYGPPADDFTISCLLYTSPSPRDRTRSRMPSSA